MLAAVGVAGVPLAIAALVQAVATGLQEALGVQSTAGVLIGLLGGLFALAALVWHVVLVVVGAALARGIGYGLPPVMSGTASGFIRDSSAPLRVLSTGAGYISPTSTTFPFSCSAPGPSVAQTSSCAEVHYPSLGDPG